MTETAAIEQTTETAVTPFEAVATRTGDIGIASPAHRPNTTRPIT